MPSSERIRCQSRVRIRVLRSPTYTPLLISTIHRDRCPRSPCGALSSRITTVPMIGRLSRIVARQSRRNKCPRYRAPPRGGWKHHVRNVPAVCRPASCHACVVVRFRQPGWECRRAVGKPAGSNTPPCTDPRCRRGTSDDCGIDVLPVLKHRDSNTLLSC